MTTPLLAQAESRAIPLANASVHCIITSPPYWNLRDYGTGEWQGGSSECDHVREPYRFNGPKQTHAQVSGHVSKEEAHNRTSCGTCGATRIDQQLGLEKLHDCAGWATGQSCGSCYICHMRAVARECWRVLRDDGTLWLNIGDSYASSGTSGHQRLDELGERLGTGGGHKHSAQLCGRAPTPPGLKSKNLCGIPWRLALALQADGWTLRSEIIWHKPNPMPESVTDRPTRSHEQVFLFSKGERYFYDADAVREQNTPDMQRRAALGHTRGPNGAIDKSRHDAESLRGTENMAITATGRNSRTVWTLATEPTPYAHFATFPTELVRRCILAGTSAHGVCSACKAPWVREVEKVLVKQYDSRHGGYHAKGTSDGMVNMSKTWSPGTNHVTTTGWQATCACQAPRVRAVVFDPFCGSGTTLQVARELGRASVGTDLSSPYLHDIARQRLGFTDLDAWAGKTPAPRVAAYAELPLFAGS